MKLLFEIPKSWDCQNVYSVTKGELEFIYVEDDYSIEMVRYRLVSEGIEWQKIKSTKRFFGGQRMDFFKGVPLDMEIWELQKATTIWQQKNGINA